jgi:putative drug exporter of the RND superfamily
VYMNLARWCFVHRRAVVAGWVATIVLAGIAVGAVGSGFGADPEAPASESRTGFEILEEHFNGLGAGAQGAIVFAAEQGVDDPQVRAAVEELFAQADEHRGISVTSPYAPEAFGQVSEVGELAGKVAYARVEIGDEIPWSEAGEVGRGLAERAAEIEDEVPGLQVEIGGEVLAGFEPPEAELIGLSFAVVVLIISFGSVLAMGLPIAVAVAGVGLGLMLTSLISNDVAMPDFAVQIGAMIGLGVGIDYALFIVTRFREHLHRDDPPQIAAMGAIDTAGRAVVFAGVTVVASLLGLFLIGLDFIAGLGVAAATTVAVTMAASTTLLPALLGFAQLKVEMTRRRGLVAAGCVSVALLGAGLGARPLLLGIPAAVVVLAVGTFVPFLRREVPRRTPKPVRESVWYRWSHLIQRRPWPFAIGGTLLLLVLATPLLGLRLGFSDEGNFPEGSTTRQAYDLLSEGFGPGFNGPFVVVTTIDGFEELMLFQAVVDAVGRDPGVASVTPAFPNDFEQPTAALARVVPTTSPQDEATEALIERLRAEVIPAAADDRLDVAVTGFVAVSVDFSGFLAGRSILFFAVVLTVSFVLLTMVFRSLLVPLKAVILNMLSIAGAYGIVVAIFQWGWFGGITGIEPAPIEPFIPMMMFAIVFGLSMDYEVFLLSRIREEYERTGDARDSVADGLAATARVISAAAAIMVVVFGSFLLEDNRIIRVFGTGLGMAVLLDATLVRLLLVPATMELLGERNWWIPRWLDARLPHLHVEGSPDHEARLAQARAELETAGPEPVGPVLVEPPVPLVAGGPDPISPAPAKAGG